MSPLILLLLAESAALVIALYFLTLRGPRGPSAAPRAGPGPIPTAPRSFSSADTEPELPKRLKELTDARAQISDLRDQLKRAKRDRFEQKQASREGESLVRERETIERTASQQLEVVRAELAHALNEVDRMKSESSLPKERRTTVPAQPVGVAPPQPAAPTPPIEPPPPRTRELSATDQAKIDRAERKATAERLRTLELDRELKRIKGKAEMHSRLYLVMKGEVNLVRDKFKALEKRLNRTLLERDLMLRAIRQLERESGKTAERTELTPEEMAASDARTEATQKAENQEAPTTPETVTEDIIPKANA